LTGVEEGTDEVLQMRVTAGLEKRKEGRKEGGGGEGEGGGGGDGRQSG